MKNFKKLFALLLVVAMMFAVAMPVMAGTITINNTVAGQDYTAYKIFDVTYKNTDGNAGNDTFAYSIAKNSKWYDVVDGYANVTLTAVAGNDDIMKVTVLPAFDAADFAAYLMENKPVDAPVAATAEAAGTSVDLTVGAGYYLVDSTMGALCILDTADDTVTIYEKNSVPTIDKDVNGQEEETTASIGDTVNFAITVNTGTTDKNADGTGTGVDADYVLTDVMVNLTYGDDIAIAGWTKDTDYTAVWDDEDKELVITLKQAKLATLAEATDIAITYTATVDASALTVDNQNKNTVTLVYNNYTTSSTTYVDLYQFEIVKTDESGKVITDAQGAKFTLYDAATDGDAIVLVWDAEKKAYRPDVAGGSETNTTIDMSNAGPADLDGYVRIYGLAAGNYWLEETDAPDGYNILEGRQAVALTANNNATVTDGAYVSGGIQIVNVAGQELPETGGMGTKLFILFGSVAVLLAGIFLITNKRMAKENI